MFARTILSLIIIGAVAGGVVYYGTGNGQFSGIYVPIREKQMDINTPKPDVSAEKMIANTAGKTVLEPNNAATVNPKHIVALVNLQIAKLTDQDMRDQANLDIVNYAVRHGLMEEATSAMSEISQIELRETARSRIAVALAKSGKTKEAFALVDKVEIEGLRDVMRLQVIEAITVPGFPTQR